MTRWRQLTAAKGEDMTVDFLRKQGWRILKRNLRTNFGEIDILSLDGRTLVITEVKTKSRRDYGSALEMVGYHKIQKLILLAKELMIHYKTTNIRIDIAAIDSFGANEKLTYYKGVVEQNVS